MPRVQARGRSQLPHRQSPNIERERSIALLEQQTCRRERERGWFYMIPVLSTVLILALCLISQVSNSGVNQPGPLSEQRL